jgi:iron complex transport system permease protein
MGLKHTLFIIVLILLIVLHFTIGFGYPIPETIFFIRLNILLQEVLIACILAMGGMILQTLLINPLAEPYLLGISGAASFTSVLAAFFMFSPMLLFRTSFSVIGAILLFLLIFTMSKRKFGFSIGSAVLFGIAFNAFFSSSIMVFQNLLMPNQFSASVRWIMGSIDSTADYEILLLVLALTLELTYFLRFRKELDIYLSGEEMALAVGIETERLKILGFAAVCLATGIAVSVCGMIGFVGLIVPHLAKMIFRKNSRFSWLWLFVTSSILMIGAGIISKNLVPGAIFPIGVVTSLIGAPFFALILFRQGKRIG